LKRKKQTSDVTVPLTGEEVKTAANRLGAIGASNFGVRKKGKSEFEVKSGTEFSANGQLMRKIQVIDRRFKDNKIYRETVTNVDTGEVVRHVIERLSQHTGRGSASKK
jgi:hypothetical protein